MTLLYINSLNISSFTR